MKKFDELPKSVKKTIRYISPSIEDLTKIQQLVNHAIEQRKKKSLE
ncbi:LytR family transcriptional regulator [Priestia megaterium]